MKKLIAWTSLILAVSLFAEPGENKGQLKRSMKVVPLSSTYLSIENGGTNHASAALSDGVGVYTTQEDEYAKAISYLNSKYGDEALKDEKSLKDYVLDTGTVADKELANKLNLNATQKSNPGDSCDDGNPQTENDIYLDENFTCKGKKIYNSVKCYGYTIGSEFEFEGKSYLVVSNDTIKSNLNRAETLCTSNVTDMGYLFESNYYFNEDIGSWDVSNVTNMNAMFYEAEEFNYDLNEWDMSSVVSISDMFNRAFAFNGNIGDWDTSNITDMDGVFSNTNTFDRDISKWDTSKVTSISFMFSNSNFDQNIDNWDVSNVKNMTYTFNLSKKFNKPLNNWDVSNVTSMDSIFRESKAFSQDLNNWDMSNVGLISKMFADSVFNGNISDWNVSHIGSLDETFKGAVYFNQDISRWDVSNLTNMYATFQGAINFNQDLSKWCTSKVIFNYPNYNSVMENTPAWEESKRPILGTCPEQ